MGEPQCTYVFYGVQFSLYAGKVRSYLRKKGIPFREIETNHPDFAKAAARAGTGMQPMVETPDGEILQDTSAIIDALEARHPRPGVVPEGPCQRLVALLLEVFGDEGLLKPAMHYRWNFPEANEAFLEAEFSRAMGPARVTPRPPGGRSQAQDESGLKVWQPVSNQMRERIVPDLGVTEASAPAIEEAYENLLDLLDAHFRELPYLLGGRPSIGDFGMLAPLYAHLGRDPYPSALMKKRAPACHRWVERMNVADCGMAEFPVTPEEFLPDDEIPQTLEPILALMAQDFLPELMSTIEFLRAWRSDHPEIKAGSKVPSANVGMGTGAPLGRHVVRLRGTPIDQVVRHYSLWMWQRPLDAYRSLNPEERAPADALLDRTGLRAALETDPGLRIERRDNAEYFA